MHWGTRRVLLRFAFAAFLSANEGSRGAVFSFSNNNFISVNDSTVPPTQISVLPAQVVDHFVVTNSIGSQSVF
jgi:hypothetical protein